MCRSVLCGVVLVVVTTACAHGEAFDGSLLRKGDVEVRLGPLPSSWRRVDVEGADLAFHDDARASSTLFDVRCGRRDDDAPLSALTMHLIMGTTEREFETQETIPFDGREAMHSRLRAKLDGVPMEYDIYVVKKDGCVYDIVYVAPPDHFAEGTLDFERFALGVHAVSLSSPRAVSSAVSSQPSGSTPNDP
jgi:hypothetical protein